MFKDKHVIIAMLVAPVLAVIAWYGVDQIVAEDPHAARPGAAYPLVAKSNCRYASGRCELANGDFQLLLVAGEPSSDGIDIELTSVLALQGVQVGVLTDGSEDAPVTMRPVDQDRLVWTVEMQRSAGAAELRVVAKANDAIWYAEIPTVFLDTPGVTPMR